MSDESKLSKIGAYVDGELEASERSEIEDLIENSEEYKQLARSFQWLDQVAGQERLPRVSEDQWTAVKKEILRRAREPGKSDHAKRPPALELRLKARKLLPLAAVALVALALAWAAGTLLTPPQAGPENTPPVASTDDGSTGGAGAAQDTEAPPEPQDPGFAEGKLKKPEDESETETGGGDAPPAQDL